MKKIDDIEWRVSEASVPYEEAFAFMNERAAAIRDGTASECIWLLEHPPLFTSGTLLVLDKRKQRIAEEGRYGRQERLYALAS